MIKRYDLSTHAAEQGLLVYAALGDFIRYADHAAFVARVREIAEGMEHEESCSLHAMSQALRSALGLTANKCTCPRGKLLALCEVK